jgi:hypothetical protein
VAAAGARQYFAGWWFHPIGLMLGGSHMMEWVWGSLLVAALLKWLVGWFGGAQAIRRRFQPFFAGAFAGAVVVMVFFHVVAAWVVANGGMVFYSALP